jgi:5-methylcytosine-specific restriction protein A
MPYAPRPYCRLCNQIAEETSSYCSKHKQAITQKEIDRHIHNNKVYGNTAWRRLRRVKLNANPLCELHLAMIPQQIVAASQVDHIIPITKQPELQYVYENLQSLCEICHTKKTREENK